MHGKIKKVFFRVIHYAIMVMITVLMLMPIGWMLGTSMRQSKESFVLPPSFWPTQFNLDNFKQVFHAIPILKFAWNSLFITFLAAAFMVLFTSMAAYAFARINFKGKNILFIFMLAGLMRLESFLINKHGNCPRIISRSSMCKKIRFIKCLHSSYHRCEQYIENRWC